MNDHTNGNGNGNGNGKGESKSLAELAVQRRQEVRKKINLCDAAKLLFDDLTDLCFLSKFSVGFGVVRVGKPLLAERLGCSVPTITRAQRALTASELWTRTGWYEGHEITIWFLRGIADGQLEFDQFTQGATRGPARTKVSPRVESVRNGHGQFCKQSETPDLPENKQATAEMTVHPGQSCREATVSSAVATPSELTGGNRQNQPSGHGRTDRGERSVLTGAHGQIHRAGPVSSDASTTAGLTGYKDKEMRNGDKPDPHHRNGNGKASREDAELDAWRQSLNGRFPSHLEKLRAKLIVQRDAATAPNVRVCIGRKVKILNELLDGPTPEPEKPAPAKARRTAEKQPTEKQLLTGAQYLVGVGKTHLLSKEQKALLERDGELAEATK